MSRVWLICGMACLIAISGCKKEAAAPPADSGATTETPANDSVDLGTPSTESTTTETPAPAATPPAPAAATPPAPAAGTPVLTATGAVDLRYVADDSAMALVLRPSQALSNPVVQGIIKELEAVNPEFKLADRLEEMRSQLGFEASEIDHILVVVDQNALAMIPTLMFGGMMGPPGGGFEVEEFEATPVPAESNCDDAPPAGFGPDGSGPEMGSGPPMPTVVVKFNRAIDPQKLAESGSAQAESKTHAGKNYFLLDGMLAAWPQDATTLVYATEPKMTKLIDGQFGNQGSIAKTITPLAGRDLALIVDVTQLHELIGMLASENPAAAMGAGFAKQVNTLTLAADLQGKDLLQLQLHCLNEGSASGLKDMLGMFVQQGQEKFAADATNLANDLEAEYKPLVPIATELVKSASVTAEGAVCTISLSRPSQTEQLPELIRPALKKTAEAAAAAKRLNSLKMIALAFHNYEAVYGNLPAAGGPGAEDRPGKGLSWRVHVLPFLGEFALYEQFNLEEPWDSEHNKASISKMPAIFGSNPEGKTTLHVFTGEGTIFKGDNGVKFGEVTDGTSNTILAVEAGPESADIWTKPGGLTPDSANPLAVLGTVGDSFGVVMLDGYARLLPKTIDAETFKNLVNPADGNVTNLP